MNTLETALSKLGIGSKQKGGPNRPPRCQHVNPGKLLLSPLDRPPPDNVVRFVCLSDTHNQTSRMKFPVPDGDVLLHAGDFTMGGSHGEACHFNHWLGGLSHKHKVVIAGNHEWLLDDQATGAYNVKKAKEVLTNATYIQDQLISIAGINIYGSPWTPEYHCMAFNVPRGEGCREKWSSVPTNTDILMTHGPPRGYNDFTVRGIYAGCDDLLEIIQKVVKPKYHVFGHIHEGYGVTTDGTTTYVNVAMCNVHYEPVNKPLVLDFPVPEGESKYSKPVLKE